MIHNGVTTDRNTFHRSGCSKSCHEKREIPAAMCFFQNGTGIPGSRGSLRASTTRPRPAGSSPEGHTRVCSISCRPVFKIGHTRRKFPAIPAATSRFNAYLAAFQACRKSRLRSHARYSIYIAKLNVKKIFADSADFFAVFGKNAGLRRIRPRFRVFPRPPRLFLPVFCKLFPRQGGLSAYAKEKFWRPDAGGPRRPDFEPGAGRG